METGRLWEGDMMRIVVADEISPDSCRLWDIKSQDKLDKDRFRKDLGGLIEAYTEVARRLGILGENEKVQNRRTAPGAVTQSGFGADRDVRWGRFREEAPRLRFKGGFVKPDVS